MALFRIEPTTLKPSNQQYYAAVPDTTEATSKSVKSPASGKQVIARKIPKPIKAKGNIDVYRTFDWTASPINNDGFHNIAKVPFAHVTEYKFDDKAVFNSMMYYVAAFDDQIGAISTAAGSLLGVDVYKEVKNQASAVFDKIKKATGTPVDLDKASEAETWMKPYSGLYKTNPTGFQYFFPYFENPAFQSVDSSYTDLTFPRVNAMKTAREATLDFSRLIAPGQFIEAPQIFQMSSSNGQRATIRFPLLNTISFESAVRNYQLLWLLVFQNTPQRITKSIVDFPKIYDVQIPGVKFLKYAFVESMSIDFIGVRRRLTIPMPKCEGNPDQAEVVIPDAYNVTMTFKSLLATTNNAMLENWKLSKPAA